MKHIKLEDGLVYDGSQIEPHWAFRQFGVNDSSIVTWIGPMNIKSSNIIDYEDVGREIKAHKMLHFILEHFDSQPADIRLCYHRQRLLVTIVKDVLDGKGIKTKRRGDDLYLEGGKLSVSIATCSVSSMKIHLGLNVTTHGTPQNVLTAGIMESGSQNVDFKMETLSEIVDEICQGYLNEIVSIEEDITKTKIF